MNWRQLVTSPPPAAVWDLDMEDAAVVHRVTPGEFHCASEGLPPNAFEIGPVGLQTVDRKLIGTPLAKLRGAAEGTTTAAVIVPSGWLRSFLMPAEQLPRREREVEDVVRWRLKKLLPVSPTELRLSIVRLPEIGGSRQIMVLAGVERAVAALEEAFTEVGVEVGFITTRLFALAGRMAAHQHPAMLVQVEDGYLSLMVIQGGLPRLLRTKLLPPRFETVEAIERELRLTVEFVRDRIGLDGELHVTIVCPKPELDGDLHAWLAGRAGIAPATDPPPIGCGPALVADRIGTARLAPAMAVVTGAVT
jgi:hypothetical protein